MEAKNFQNKGFFTKYIRYPVNDIQDHESEAGMTQENRRKCSRMIKDSEYSRLGGINVGKYPLHHFLFDHSTPLLENWPIRIDFAGDDEWRRGCYRFRERSDTFAIEYMKQGTLRFTQNRQSYTVQPGELFLVRLGDNSEIECCDCDYAFKRTFAIAGPLLGPLLTSLGLDRADVMTPSDPAALDALFDRAREILDGCAEDRQRRSALLSFEILLMLAEDYKQHDHPEILQKILRYLDAHLDRPHTIERIASEFRLSPATLHRLFRKHLGETPINFLIHRRMETAMRLLRLTEQPIKSIAYQVGYPNALYFSTEFHRHTGESPTAFRRRRQYYD